LSTNELQAVYNAGTEGKCLPQCTPPPSGIISWWPGDDSTNDIVSGHNGTLQGTATYGTGEVVDAFDLNGSSYVAVPDNNAWAFGTNSFTIELWANFRSINESYNIGYPDAVFVGQDEGGGDANKWFFALSAETLNFHINDPVNGPTFLVQAGFTPNLDQWYHLAVVRNGNLFTIYVNGVAIGSETSSRVIPNAAATLTMGQAEGLGYMDGKLDEVTIYSRALSTNELQAVYNAGTTGKCH
jgi:hypothetical protein